MPTFIVTPQTVPKTTPVTITFTGTGTTWNITPPTITVSAGSLGTVTATAATLATATFTPPTTPQLVTFTDTTDGSLVGAVSVVTQSISISPATFNKSTATPFVITGLGVNWNAVPTLTASAGAFSGLANASSTQTSGIFTPSATLGSITITDTTDGSITCTATIVQSLSVAPVVCPVTTPVQVLFSSFTAGWTSGTLPTITASVGSLSALTFINSSLCYATYTPPGTPQIVTFTDTTDGSITCTMNVVVTNTYTYTLQDMLTAGVFYGRWSKSGTNSFAMNAASTLLFSLSAPFSAVFANGLSAANPLLFYAGGSGNLSAPANAIVPSYGSPIVAQLYSNATEAQYNISVGLGNSGNVGVGWNTAIGSASSKVALTIYSTAASKPALQPYVDNYLGTGTSITMPTPPSPFQADGSMNTAGNSAVSPSILSGVFGSQGYGIADFAASATITGGVNLEVAPPVGSANLPAGASAGIFPKARFRATTPAIYVLMTGGNPITVPSGTTCVPWHLETDNHSYLDIIPTTPFVNTALLQWLPIATGLDATAEHEYSLHGGYGAAGLDKIMLPGGSFAMKPPAGRLAGAVIGDSHTQGSICAEAYGSQAGAYAHYLSRRNGGLDMVNLGIAGDKLAGLTRTGKALATMPILANGVAGNGPVPASFTATVSGGAVTAITTVTGGSGYSGSSIELVILSSEGGIGAYAVASIVGGVIQASPAVQAGGSGYTAAPAVFAPTTPNASGVMGKGVPDFWIENMGFNDQSSTARATARAQLMVGLGQWLTTCNGPLISVYTYGCGQPFIAPLTGSYTTTYSNYDKQLVLNAIAAQRPDYYARIIIADLSSLSIAVAALQCFGATNTGGVISTPGWSHGGHFSCQMYDTIASLLDPAVKLALGRIRRFQDA